MAKNKTTKKTTSKKSTKASSKAKASKTTKGKTPVQKNEVKPVTAVVAAPAVAAPAVAAPVAPVQNEVVEQVPEVAILENHVQRFQELLSNIQQFKTQLNLITSQVKSLQKSSEKEFKKMIKQSKKKKDRSKNRAPSGFVKPALISKELASFLGKPVGTEMARTEVTREINSYIRAHKLQDPSNGRIINADSKLRKLLNLKKEDELTYFNLQRYMSPHFAKKGSTVSA